MIDLAHKSESRHCIQCFRCVNPAAKGGIRLQLRWPGEELRAIADHSPSLSEVLLLFVVMGIINGNFLWELPAVNAMVRQIRTDASTMPDWRWLNEKGPLWLCGAHSWLGFLSIVVCTIGCAALFLAVLTALTALASRLLPQRDGAPSRRRAFALLGYPYAPVAMASVFIGFGSPLFDLLDGALPSVQAGKVTQGIVLLAGMGWSLATASHILGRMDIPWSQRWRPLVPELTGTVLVGVMWWPVITA